MNIFLPIILSISSIGMYINLTPSNAPIIQQYNLKWVVIDNINWANGDAELQYRRSQVDLIIKNHAEPYIIIHGAPDYIGDPPEVYYISGWRQWVRHVAEAFPDVNYIQVWNEPNIRYGEKGYYGGWGTEYIDRYILFLSVAREEIKKVNPNAQILIGLSNEGNEWLREFADRGGLSYVDIIGYHFYTHYPNTINFPTWPFSYGKPVWLTETNLLCYEEATPDFYIAQAEYFKKTRNVIFYGWNSGWTCGSDLEDNPYLTR